MMVSKRIFLSLILAFVLPVTMVIGPALSISHEEIFNWVADELAISNDYSMPEIRLVSKEELQWVFKENTERSYQRWSQMYGSDEADRILDFYLQEVIGLFDPDTQIIYIGSFLDSCRQEAIVAHELTHFFQLMQQGKIDSNAYGADQIRAKNEIQAGIIENQYIKTFCQKSNPKNFEHP